MTGVVFRVRPSGYINLSGGLDARHLPSKSRSGKKATGNPHSASVNAQRHSHEFESLSKKVSYKFQRCAVLAQLLRLRLFADCLGVMELNRQQTGNEAAELEEFQQQSSDPTIDGGFSFARQNSQLTPDGNTVATLFPLQALGMWEQTSSGSFR